MLNRKKMKIAIINGPNLNLIGIREPDIYGSQSLEDYFVELQDKFSEVSFIFYQSNIEGELVNKLQEVGFSCDGIVLNAGAYTHTSVDIWDAIAAIKTPVIEVHISNIAARESFRTINHISAKSKGTITDLGMKGYELAVRWFLDWLVT